MQQSLEAAMQPISMIRLERESNRVFSTHHIDTINLLDDDDSVASNTIQWNLTENSL